MAAGVAQEELQRVGRRLLRNWLRRRRRRRLALLDLRFQHLDAALLELAEDRVGLERLEMQRLENLVEVLVAQRPCLLGLLEQFVQLAGRQDVIDFYRGHRDKQLPATFPRRSNPLAGTFWARCTITGVMSTSNP